MFNTSRTKLGRALSAVYELLVAFFMSFVLFDVMALILLFPAKFLLSTDMHVQLVVGVGVVIMPLFGLFIGVSLIRTYNMTFQRMLRFILWGELLSLLLLWAITGNWLVFGVLAFVQVLVITNNLRTTADSSKASELLAMQGRYAKHINFMLGKVGEREEHQQAAIDLQAALIAEAAIYIEGGHIEAALDLLKNGPKYMLLSNDDDEEDLTEAAESVVSDEQILPED